MVGHDSSFEERAESHEYTKEELKQVLISRRPSQSTSRSAAKSTAAAEAPLLNQTGVSCSCDEAAKPTQHTSLRLRQMSEQLTTERDINQELNH